jgi:hypothetical protein
VRVAFAGKGGSGKTTLSSMFVRHLAAKGLPVVAIDAYIKQHLGEALGADGDPPGDERAPRRDQELPARHQPPAPRSSTSAPNWSTADPLPRGRQHLGSEPGDVLAGADRVTGTLSHHHEVPDPRRCEAGGCPAAPVVLRPVLQPVTSCRHSPDLRRRWPATGPAKYHPAGLPAS